jgi:hypothetical protein
MSSQGDQVALSSAALQETPASALTLSPRTGAEVRAKLCVFVADDGTLHQWIGGRALEKGFGPGVETPYSDYSGDEVGLFRQGVKLDGVASAALLFEAGPNAGVVECGLRGITRTVDLYRPSETYVVVRMDFSDLCDLRRVWAPLEIHVIGASNRASRGQQCVISAIYTDYPRRRTSVKSVGRFKMPPSNWRNGDNDEIIVDRGVCIFSNPQRTAVEILCHDWSGLVVLRRGPLLNIVDLYAPQRYKGLIVSESCDVAIGKNTGLGIGEAPMFGAFLDVFNP